MFFNLRYVSKALKFKTIFSRLISLSDRLRNDLIPSRFKEKQMYLLTGLSVGFLPLHQSFTYNIPILFSFYDPSLRGVPLRFIGP